jgi:hypothetical protein
MTERQAIYDRRAAWQPKPWTADPILQQYRFCNVFRELDKVTVWIRENIREMWPSHPHLWLMLAIARTINHPPTLRELMNSEGSWPCMHSFEPHVMGQVLDRIKARGDQVYTGAYMIRAESDSSCAWYSWTKQQYIARIVLGRLWDDRELWTYFLDQTGQRSLRECWERLLNYHGWGPFMSYEVVTDLRHTRYLVGAPDVETWANAGPGALRGLNRLLGRRLDFPFRKEEALSLMRSLLPEAPSRLPEGFPKLELRDIEHSLCETDKYLRVKNGEGRPRSKFTGT